MIRYLYSGFSLFLLWLAFSSFDCHAEDLRVAIIGTDSSHSVEFTRILNDRTAPDHIDGAKIVAAFRGGNPTLALSRDRIEKFSSELVNKWSIPFVSSIPELCSRVDGILILSVDPSARLREFEQAAACHKPIFVDKPAAGTLGDVQQIALLAKRLRISWFSSSALRFVMPPHPDGVTSADVWGPGAMGTIEEGYPLDLAWYGIHSIEALSSAMGPGIVKVSRVHTKDSDIITAIWNNGRTGTIHLIRPEAPFSIRLRLSSGETMYTDLKINYAQLVSAIVTLIRTQATPVSVEQTLEVFAVLDAAQRSMNANGSLVYIEEHRLAP